MRGEVRAGAASKGKGKFRIGQVVHVTFVLQADAYGKITGYDNGYWHVEIREHEHKISNEMYLRPLTRRESGRG